MVSIEKGEELTESVRWPFVAELVPHGRGEFDVVDHHLISSIMIKYLDEIDHMATTRRKQSPQLGAYGLKVAAANDPSRRIQNVRSF